MSDLAASRTATRWLIASLGGRCTADRRRCRCARPHGVLRRRGGQAALPASFWLMDTVRERSVAIRAADIAVPERPGRCKRIASGAAQYDEMCSLCHLAPG